MASAMPSAGVYVAPYYTCFWHNLLHATAFRLFACGPGEHLFSALWPCGPSHTEHGSVQRLQF
jgi:hypothetical protein